MKALECIFLGYVDDAKGYTLFDAKIDANALPFVADARQARVDLLRSIGLSPTTEVPLDDAIEHTAMDDAMVVVISREQRHANRVHEAR